MLRTSALEFAVRQKLGRKKYTKGMLLNKSGWNFPELVVNLSVGWVRNEVAKDKR